MDCGHLNTMELYSGVAEYSMRLYVLHWSVCVSGLSSHSKMFLLDVRSRNFAWLNPLVLWQDTEAAHCSNAGSKIHCTSCTMWPTKHHFPSKGFFFFFNREAASKPNLLKAHTLQLFTHWPIKFPFWYLDHPTSEVGQDVITWACF